jgi:hypothetical protein
VRTGLRCVLFFSALAASAKRFPPKTK